MKYLCNLYYFHLVRIDQGPNNLGWEGFHEAISRPTMI
jgi:hypothetical protein